MSSSISLSLLCVWRLSSTLTTLRAGQSCCALQCMQVVLSYDSVNVIKGDRACTCVMKPPSEKSQRLGGNFNLPTLMLIKNANYTNCVACRC